MIRPYFAVLKDCFREALASRILWLLTGLITLVLFLGFAPFALREEAGSRFQRSDFRDGAEFMKLLAAQDSVRAPTPARRVWLWLPESLRHRLKAMNHENSAEQADVLRAVRDELNGMLGSNDLYDPACWPTKSLSGEGKRLADAGAANLSPEEKHRLNRLLIDAAFPDHLLPAPGKVLRACWFGYAIGAPLPFEPKQLPLLVNFALVYLTTFLAGILGVFVAILVTAPMVPQTFEPGAVDLLLSKPVSRSLLFLTKFFGASVFILLNSAYLIGGMWLIAGLRFDIWSGRLLYCIPVFLFLFVVYYSISALTGVIWKNPIVSVACTVVFWGLCFVVGVAKSVAENQFIEPARIAAILPAGDKLLAVNRAGQTFEWLRDEKTWDEIFRGREDAGPLFLLRPNLLGPVYDPKTERLYAIESARTRFEFLGGSGTLLTGPRNQEWRRIESCATPGGPQALFADPKGRITVVTLAGIFRFDGDPTREHKPFKVMGVDIAPRDRSSRFVRIGPNADLKWHRPFAAAMNPADGSLAVYANGRLCILSLDANENYVVRRQIDLQTAKPAIISFVGSRVAVAQADGSVRIVSGASRTEESLLKPSGTAKPRCASASSDGRLLAVVFDDGIAWLYDVEQRVDLSGEVAGQGDVAAVAFTPKCQLLVAHGFGRVTAYETAPLKQAAVFAPPAELLEILYRFVVMPIYTVCPKLNQLDLVVAKLVIGDPVVLFEEVRGDRDAAQVERIARVDVWHVVGSNLLFVAIVLAATCVYITRRDF